MQTEEKDIPISSAERKALAKLWQLSTRIEGIITDAAWSFDSRDVDNGSRRQGFLSLDSLLFNEEMWRGTAAIAELNDTHKVTAYEAGLPSRLGPLLRQKDQSLADIKALLRDFDYTDAAGYKTMASVTRDFNRYINAMGPITEQDIDNAMQKSEFKGILLSRERYLNELKGVQDALIPEMQRTLEQYRIARAEWYAAFCDAHPDLVEHFKLSASEKEPQTDDVSANVHGGTLPESTKRAPSII